MASSCERLGVQAMIQALNVRAAEIAMEMQTLEELERDGLGARSLVAPLPWDLLGRSCLVHRQSSDVQLSGS